jgi:hypothetical protein
MRLCTGDLNEIMNKATCLSLLSNAVLGWNTRHIEHTVNALRAQGHAVDDRDLARTSPLVFHNILVHGTYDFRDADQLRACEKTRNFPALSIESR